MTSSSPIGLEGSDLSSINTMMSAVMSVGKVAENGRSPQSIKSPTKPPGPNRIGRRNQETKEEKSSYSCPLCEKICTTQHQLTMHIRQHNTDTGGADHSCSICGKSLSSASSLDRHMLVHSGERPYKCAVCGQSFTTNGNMHRCYNCGGLDHHAKECSLPPQPKKCHCCQSITHMVANCPHKTAVQPPASSQGRQEAEPQPCTSTFPREVGGGHGCTSFQEARSELSEWPRRSPPEASSTKSSAAPEEQSKKGPSVQKRKKT